MTPRHDRASVLTAFRQKFQGPARLFRAPARINIIGEHTDYNDGLVLPVNADLHTWVAVARRADRAVRMHTLNFNEVVEVSLDDLRRHPDGGWQQYPTGVLHVLQREGYELPGADILIAGEVPIRSGLSSSASLETAVAFAMLACAGYAVDRRELARLCQAAENEFVGVSCGIMDQFVISACTSGNAMMLDCRNLETRLAAIPSGAALLVVHSGVHRQLSDGGYNARRRECEAVIAALSPKLNGARSLRDIGLGELEQSRAILGDALYRRAKHVITENDRVLEAYRAMQGGELETLGRAMTESHKSLRNDFEVSCEQVDALVDIALGCDGVFGSRMVGGGFGGCTVTLIDAARTGTVTGEVCDRYEALVGQTPWHHVLASTGPVDEVRAA